MASRGWFKTRKSAIFLSFISLLLCTREVPALDISLHSAFKVILVLMFCHVWLFFSRADWRGSKDEMLLDMINKQRTSVNVCSYTYWMTGCNWLQPVWCNKAHYYANPASPCDSNVVCWVTEGEKGKRQSRVWDWEGKRANEWLRVGVIAVCLLVRLSVPLRSL